MAREESRGKRPFKIWDGFRNIRKSLVVSSLRDLEIRGKEKLNIAQNVSVRLVLETDGTQIEDSEYFRTLPNNTTVLLLRDDEFWYPSGVDAIKTAIAAIPKIVCETIHSLELHDAAPSWKIMDNKGRITVVLHWDPQRNTNYRGSGGGGGGGGGGSGSGGGGGGGGGSGGGGAGMNASTSKRTSYFHSGGFGVSGLLMDNANRWEPDQNAAQHNPCEETGPLPPPPIYRHGSMPQITVIHHDTLSPSSHSSQNNEAQQQQARRMSKQGCSSMDAAAIHVHTAECSHNGKPKPLAPMRHSGSAGGSSPVGGGSRASSPARDPLIAAAAAFSSMPPSDHGFECDFHCCTLHEEGRRIAVQKSVATSPIQECRKSPASPPITVIQPVPSSLSDGTRRGSPKGHVRFLDTNTSAPIPPPPLLPPSPPSSPSAQQQQTAGVQQLLSPGTSNGRKQSPEQQHELQSQQSRSDDETTDSETETTVIEDESMTSEKVLLLIDQLTTAQNKHLSIKDIGIILERLNSKIVDVERLDRDFETSDCYNWTIKATIKGNVLQEVGIIYNSNYYGISEHPGYGPDGEYISQDDRELLDDDDGASCFDEHGATAAAIDDRLRRRAEEEVNI